jgi:hypothetical protein
LARREGREEETGQGDGTERTEQRGRNREDGIERMEQRRREREDRIERTGQRTRQGGRNGKDGTRRTKKREWEREGEKRRTGRSLLCLPDIISLGGWRLTATTIASIRPVILYLNCSAQPKTRLE